MKRRSDLLERGFMILNTIAEKLKRQSKDDFRGRQFEAWLIIQAACWYLRYPLSYRNLEEMFRERGFEVDHSRINRWVLAYAPMIEKRLRQFRKPHCGSIRADETYVKIRGQWRYLYRAIDKHGNLVDFLLTAKRDLDAAKRFFRKMLKDEPLLSPGKIGTDGANTLSLDNQSFGRRAAAPSRSSALCHQASPTRHRKRPFSGEEEHAETRRVPLIQHGPKNNRGLRSHAVVAQGLRLFRRLDRQRSE
jgi:transposase-like protein